MDGTLADSYPWFLSIMSAVCDKFGLRQIGPHDIDALRGSDSARILEWLEVPRWKLPVIVRHMRTPFLPRLRSKTSFSPSSAQTARTTCVRRSAPMPG